MRTWHAVTINGSFSFEIKEPIDEARDLLRNTLTRIDGTDRQRRTAFEDTSGNPTVDLGSMVRATD